MLSLDNSGQVWIHSTESSSEHKPQKKAFKINFSTFVNHPLWIRLPDDNFIIGLIDPEPSRTISHYLAVGFVLSNHSSAISRLGTIELYWVAMGQNLIPVS